MEVWVEKINRTPEYGHTRLRSPAKMNLTLPSSFR